MAGTMAWNEMVDVLEDLLNLFVGQIEIFYAQDLLGFHCFWLE